MDGVCTYMLLFSGSPKVTYYSNRTVAFEGNKVNFICNATNDEDAIKPVQISWYNGTQLLEPDGKHVIIYNEYDNMTDEIHSILILDSINTTDHGQYICRAYNDPLCYTEEKINLTVECEFVSYAKGVPIAISLFLIHLIPHKYVCNQNNHLSFPNINVYKLRHLFKPLSLKVTTTLML